MKTSLGFSVSKKQRHSGGLSSGGFPLQLAGIGPKKHPEGYLNEYPRTAFSYTGQSAVASGVDGIEVGISVGVNSGVSVGEIWVSTGWVAACEQEANMRASEITRKILDSISTLPFLSWGNV